MTAWWRSIVTFNLGCMIFRDTRFYCKPNMTSSRFLRQGSLQAIFHDGFWKSDRDFLIAFLSNVLCGMHDFRDNEVLLPTGYDVIVISMLGGVSHRFCCRNLKEDPSFIIIVHRHISRISYCFGGNQHFILAVNCPFRPILIPPNFRITYFAAPKRVFLTPDRVFWAIVRENYFTGMGCSSVEE